MKELVINNSLNLIKKNYPDYNEEKLEIIEYGLTSLYLNISKTIIICLIAYLLGLLKEMIIFSIIYNIIRMPSFGLHATKSWICLLSSGTIFILAPYICTIIEMNIYTKIILGAIGTFLMIKNSPADTEKRPIVNPKRRLIYKIISTIIAVTFTSLAIIIDNNFIENSLIIALLIQCIIISPLTYKIFKLPYDNYKNYRPD